MALLARGLAMTISRREPHEFFNILLDHRAMARNHSVKPVYRLKMIDIFRCKQPWARKRRLKPPMTEAHFTPGARARLSHGVARRHRPWRSYDEEGREKRMGSSGCAVQPG